MKTKKMKYFLPLETMDDKLSHTRELWTGHYYSKITTDIIH